ncbi:MAGUK p55 subfamily member 4-like [Morone saxatilis]|uniref:MAGUK p55 subfamily member 4-like n=1 Tax=Morone saxatilis TaxID=34816 RepID=UPI0015E1CD59|nr:MAGUK p55 subfamily member 4-like [Morone saxatilis]
MRPTMEDGVSDVLSDVVEDVIEAVYRNVGGAQLLHELLSAPWLRALLKIYECLLQFQRLTPSPILPYASGLSHEIMTVIQTVPRPSAEARELHNLLSSPHIQALLSSQDSVAQLDYGPVLPPLPDEMPENEEAMRIVCLVKNNQPLGATIKRDEETGEIYIARVIHGGLADRSGLLHPGDLLVEVNGNPVVGLEPEQVIQILINSQGTILFKVIPNTAQSSSSLKSVYMRAMVDYCPLQDSSIPCPDAGMAFSRGDLLEVVDQSDGRWWQARKLPCAVSCAGLIPSASMLKSKQREQWWCQPLQVHTCIRPYLFVEYGEYKGHLYGTSTDAIDEVLKRGRMCIIDVEPHSIQPLRTRKLKPFVIFIKPPNPDRLRQSRRDARIITNYTVNRAFTEDDFVELEEVSLLIEAKYKQFFDGVLVNDDLQDTCMRLCSVIQEAQNEPQWMPVSWSRMPE